MNVRHRSRYSARHEQTDSWQFVRSFADVDVNRLLLDGTIGTASERRIAVDGSFIKKAGKAPDGLGFFYNGGNQRAEKGLESSRLALGEMSDTSGP